MDSECRVYVGVDEAGRGSLVGEMIVAIYAAREDTLPLLEEMGVRDSKELTPGRRRELYKSLARLAPFVVVPVPPWDIDRRNLVDLTEEAIIKGAGILAGRLSGCKVARITVDRYGSPRRIGLARRLLGCECPVVVEEKADARYLEVSAASIVAKHVRDERIRALRSLYGVEGSGYPSDPRTLEWLDRVLSTGLKPPIIRYSWGTLEEYGLRVKKERSRRSRSLEDFM